MIIHGQDVYFYVTAEGGDIMPICCARTASLTTASDIGETSTLGTGTWKTFKGLKNSFTISAGGLISFDMNYSIAKLRQKQVALAPINFVFFGTDAAGAMERYSGNFIVTSISTPTSYNGSWEYSVDGQGTGELTIDINPNVPFSLSQRFAIPTEDDKGLQDRDIDMQNFHLYLNNISEFYANTGQVGIYADTAGSQIGGTNSSFQSNDHSSSWNNRNSSQIGAQKDDGTEGWYILAQEDRVIIRRNDGSGWIEYFVPILPTVLNGIVRFFTMSVNGVFAGSNGDVVLGTQQFTDNAAAIAGGLTVGAIYRNGDVLQIVH
jgi:hypothetical protein